MAVWTGLEPATSCVTGRYSNQLNYQTKTIYGEAVCHSHLTVLGILFPNKVSSKLLLRPASCLTQTIYELYKM